MSGASTTDLVLSRIAGVETGDAYDVWIDTDRNIAYVSCGYSGVRIFDVSNPADPVELAHLPSEDIDGHQAYAHQVFVRGNLLFVGDGRGGLKIIDCTNSSSPEVLCQYTGHYAWAVEVEGDTAFVANGFLGSGDRLTIVNVTDSTTPEMLKSYTVRGDATDIEVVGNLVFVTTSYAGFTVLDVSNRSNPVEVGQYTGDSTNVAESGDLEIVGNLAFLTYWGHSFKVLNVSDVADIRLVAEFTESLDSFSVHIEGERDLAFLCDYEIGLVMLNISNPTQPTEITRYVDGGKPCRVEVVDDIVYMTDQDNGFVVLEIGESHPFPLGLELVILVVGVVVILAFIVRMKQGRVAG